MVDSKLNTPLHYAVAANSVHSAEVLLARETINMGLKNREGKRPQDMIRSPEMKELFERTLQKKKEAHEGLTKIEILSVNEEEEESKGEGPISSLAEPISSLNEKPSLSSYTIKAQIGKGSFGEVFLVEKKTTKERFALKVLDKLKMNSNF